MLTVRSTAVHCIRLGLSRTLVIMHTGTTTSNTLIRASSTAKGVSTMISTDQGSLCSPSEVLESPRVAETTKTTDISPNRAGWEQRGRGQARPAAAQRRERWRQGGAAHRGRPAHASQRQEAARGQPKPAQPQIGLISFLRPRRGSGQPKGWRGVLLGPRGRVGNGCRRRGRRHGWMQPHQP